LAAADLLFLMTLPLFCYMTWSKKWVLGVFTCKLAIAVRETNKFASVLILVAFSIDRCLATFQQVSIGWRRTPVAVVVCLGIWITCLAGAGGPQVVYGTVDYKTSCKVDLPWHSDIQKWRIWIYTQLTLNVVVPFAIIVAVNIILLCRLRKFADKSSKRTVTARQSLPVGTHSSRNKTEQNDGIMANADEQVYSKVTTEHLHSTLIISDR
jgi:hypothetical protein